MSIRRVLLTQGSWTAVIDQRLKRMGAVVEVVNDMRGARRVYPYATHVLLTGGGDIDPAWYNQPATFARRADPQRDAFEFWLAETAMHERKPLFGICRGHQMITVAAGGELHQDIERCLQLRHPSMHTIKVKGESRIAGWMGTRTRVVVNSYHHQAVSILPAGWEVGAASADRVIESIEHPDLPVISVQWHPEAMSTRPALSLFRSFLAL